MRSDLLAHAFSTANFVIQANLDGISQAESLQQPGGAANCVNWIAGHLLQVADTLLKEMGGQPFLSAEESAVYAMGSAALGPGSACTDIERLRAGLSQQHESIAMRLSQMPDEAFDTPFDPSILPIPLQDPRLEMLFATLAFHQAYHAGQLGLARRGIGKPSGLRI